jgi:hypothetical protein
MGIFYWGLSLKNEWNRREFPLGLTDGPAGDRLAWAPDELANK